MKKLILLALIIMAGMQTADAQRPQNRKQQTPEQRVERLDKKLNLTDEQEKQILAFYEEYAKEEITHENRKEKMEELNKKIESVLTDEQKETFSTMGKNRKRK